MTFNADTLAFDDTETGDTRLHAMGPVLIGLLAPALVLMFLDPRALVSANVLLHIYLGAIFVIATGAYIVSVFDPGRVTRIDLLESERVLALERTGLVAKKTVYIPFSDIASLRIETRYDDDGYKSSVPIIALTTHETIELPEALTEANLVAMRRLIGRH